MQNIFGLTTDELVAELKPWKIPAYRARQIANGATPMVPADRDKPTVIALRELALGKFGLEVLNRSHA